jgi:integrase
MPRTPSIRYFESRKAYYTQYRSRQWLLAAGPKDEPDGPTYKKAVDQFSKIMHADEAQHAEDNSLVSAVIVRYYHSLDRDGRKATLHQARTLLDPAVAKFGHVKVKELKPFIVQDWITATARWNSSTRHTALGCLTRAFYWAVEQGIITRNPIPELDKPEKLVRGKDVIIPEALQDVLIKAANPEFSKLLRMLRGTGARPGEVMHAECQHYRPDVGAIVFPWNPPPGEYRWKNGKKTRRDRVIYLTPELVAMVEEEIRRRKGKGRIFLTTRRVPWKSNNLVNRLDNLLEHADVKKWARENGVSLERVMCYSFRHSFITSMLTRGCPIKLLADLCGTSVAMIERTYSHAADDLHAMRRVFLQFSPQPADAASSRSGT